LAISSSEATTSAVKAWLSHPLARGLHLDAADATARHHAIIQQKPFLRRLYREWYDHIAAAVPAGEGAVLEIGSGAGFLAERVPGVVTSDLVRVAGVRVVLDARHLPFRDGALRAIVMTNVFHHISRPRLFLSEAARVVRAGGVVVMLEPWMSWWSRLIYGSFHEEPFLPGAAQWEFPDGGRLSSANGALPWIVFRRDRALFEREYPQWGVDDISLDVGMPFRYLLSGGVSLRSLAPAATFGVWRTLERALSPWMAYWAMFAVVRLKRTAA
jgi:SAM-dependent methyltransferase